VNILVCLTAAVRAYSSITENFAKQENAFEMHFLWQLPILAFDQY